MEWGGGGEEEHPNVAPQAAIVNLPSTGLGSADVKPVMRKFHVLSEISFHLSTERTISLAQERFAVTKFPWNLWSINTSKLGIAFGPNSFG